MDGIAPVMSALGWHVQIVNDADAEDAAREAIGFWKPVGIIAGAGEGTQGVTPAVAGGVPTVHFDCDPAAVWSGVGVNLDDSAVAAAALRELRDCGFSDFAYVPSAEAIHWSVFRGALFRDMAEAGGAGACGVFPSVPDEPPLVRRARLGAWLRGLPAKCGLFAANDFTAEEVLVAARMEEIAVPSRLAVVGVDDNPDICLSTVPTLTSVAVDYKAGGRKVAELLADMIAHPRRRNRRERVLYGAPSVVRRASTTLLRRRDPRVGRALDFIRRNAASGLSVDDVAAAMGCSRRLAELRFRESTGRSVLAAVNDEIFSQAQALLAAGELRAGEVADRFSLSPDTLRRMFIARTGKPPRRWRGVRCAK